MFGSTEQYDKEGLLLCWFRFPTEPPFWFLVRARESLSPSPCLWSCIFVSCWFLFTPGTSSTRHINGTRLLPTCSVWLFVTGASHSNANHQSKLASSRSTRFNPRCLNITGYFIPIYLKKSLHTNPALQCADWWSRRLTVRERNAIVNRNFSSMEWLVMYDQGEAAM